MNVGDVAAALQEVAGETPRSVRPIEGGWASFTFEVDGRYIARFPRSASIARSTRAELDLLPRLAPRVDFAVPHVRWQGTRGGFPFFVYESIPGRALTAAQLDAQPGLVDAVASALRQLHSVDLSIGRFAAGLGDDDASDAVLEAVLEAILDPVGTWRSHYAGLRTSAERHVAPLLDGFTASAMSEAWDVFEAKLDFTPAFVHADLGLEHVLVCGNRVSGIIDWETACLGDPAIDFVGLHIGIGPDRTSRILDAYGPAGATLGPRIPHYVWIGAVHAVLYGLDSERPEIVDDGLRGLAGRLRALG